jgi:hypothetical protein
MHRFHTHKSAQIVKLLYTQIQTCDLLQQSYDIHNLEKFESCSEHIQSCGYQHFLFSAHQTFARAL